MRRTARSARVSRLSVLITMRITTSVPHHIDTSQFICIANHLTGFYMMGTLVVNGLTCATNKCKKHSWLIAETYSEPSQISKMNVLAKIVNGFQSLLIFPKSSILDVWLGSEYVSKLLLIKVLKLPFLCINWYKPSTFYRLFFTLTKPQKITKKSHLRSQKLLMRNRR